MNQLKVKPSDIINQVIVEGDNIHTLQEMYNLQKDVEQRIQLFPEAINILKKVLQDVVDL